MSGPLLELRDSRIKLRSSDNLLIMFRNASLSDSFFIKSTSALLARVSPLTPLVPEKQLGPAILVVPFSSVAV